VLQSGMILTRRTFALGLLTTWPLQCVATERSPVHLSYSAGELSWAGGRTRAACGRGGVRPDKREGDGATPAGEFPLIVAMYRPDRMPAPETGLPVKPLQRSHGWVDDPKDRNYNQLVTLPYPAHVEEMWRSDGLYDLLVVIGYNTERVQPGAGSAIFLHVARPNFSGTDGCIAITRDRLVEVIRLLGPGSLINIRS
jgi:L,D-peptidoglycan transpeptidase YkuD (ErfK/YbiS/YcfS/YnhG family)